MRQYVHQFIHIERGDQRRAELAEGLCVLFGVVGPLRGDPRGGFSDGDARLLPQVFGARAGLCFEVREYLAAQRRDRILPGGDVAARVCHLA